jgi:hypothetical protein
VSLPHPGITLTTSNMASIITPTPLYKTAAGVVTTCATKPYARGCQVQVTVTYSFGLNIPYIPAGAIPLTSTSIETIQD